MLLARRPTWVRPPAVRGNGTGASASGAASQASPAPPCPASFWDAGVRSAGDSNILVRLPEFDICEAQITSQLAPFAMTPGEITALLYGARSRRTSQHCPIIPSYGHFPVDVTSVQLDWRRAPNVSASRRLETGAVTRNPPEAPSSGGFRRGRQLARRHAQDPDRLEADWPRCRSDRSSDRRAAPRMRSDRRRARRRRDGCCPAQRSHQEDWRLPPRSRHWHSLLRLSARLHETGQSLSLLQSFSELFQVNGRVRGLSRHVNGPDKRVHVVSHVLGIAD